MVACRSDILGYKKLQWLQPCRWYMEPRMHSFGNGYN